MKECYKFNRPDGCHGGVKLISFNSLVTTAKFGYDLLNSLRMKINKEWHLKNKMPEKATFENRVKWHVAHQQHCNCRAIPEKLLEEMKKRKIKF